MHADNSGDTTAFSIWMNSDTEGNETQGNTRFFVRDSGDSGKRLAGAMSASIYDGEYHHLVVSYDSSGGRNADRPEPASFILLALGSVAFIRRGRRS